jgi:hypothetical protein
MANLAVGSGMFGRAVFSSEKCGSRTEIMSYSGARPALVGENLYSFPTGYPCPEKDTVWQQKAGGDRIKIAS